VPTTRDPVTVRSLQRLLAGMVSAGDEGRRSAHRLAQHFRRRLHARRLDLDQPSTLPTGGAARTRRTPAPADLAPSEAAPAPAEAATEQQLSWIEIQLVDDDGNAVPNQPYELRLTDGSVREGRLDGRGMARATGIPEGVCQVRFLFEEGATAEVTEAAAPAPAEETHDGVYLGRMRGLHFETNKCFLLPAAVPGVRRIKQFHDAHPAGQVLVIGHTDRAGSEDYNLTVSEERAAAVAAFLTNDVAAWTAWYGSGKPAEKRWGVREDQYMLSTLGPDGGLYTGPVTGSNTQATRDAVRRFQEWSNSSRGTSLAVDGAIGPATRDALVLAYMEQDGTTLPDDVTLTTHGCGEFHPEEQTADGVASATNRRVDVFLFEASVEPPPVRCANPGCAEYEQWRAAVDEEIDAEASVDDVLEGRVFYRNGDPAPRVPFVIVVGGQATQGGYTDEEGRYRVEGVSGDAEIRLCDRLLIANTPEENGAVALAVVGGPPGGGLDGDPAGEGAGTAVA